jgi:hypothetical protein
MAWRLTDMVRAVVSKELVPGWAPNMPPAASARLPQTARDGAGAVYFTSCVNRIFGRMPARNPRQSLQEAMIALSALAGLPLWIPDDIAGHCCATIWHSKGDRKGNALMANRTKVCGAGATAAGCRSFAMPAHAHWESPARSLSISTLRIASATPGC